MSRSDSTAASVTSVSLLKTEDTMLNELFIAELKNRHRAEAGPLLTERAVSGINLTADQEPEQGKKETSR